MCCLEVIPLQSTLSMRMVSLSKGAKGGESEKGPFDHLFKELGKTPKLMHVVDWDGDGDLDVLVLYHRKRCSGYGCLHQRPVVFVERLNDGTLLKHQHVLAKGFGETLQVVDWNGDGLLDLWVDRWLYNRSVDQSLVERVGRDKPFIELKVTKGEPHFVDWNSDGEMDLIVAGHQQIQYFERRNGELNEVLDPGLGNVTVGDLDHYRLAVVDWDLDGDLDLLMTTSQGHIRYFERSAGSLVELMDHSLLQINATPPWEYSSYLYNVRVHCLQPVVADWDGDGDLDLLLAPAGIYFERLADGSLVEVPQSPFANAVTPKEQVELASFGWKFLAWKAIDCDRDGVLDLLRIHADASQEGFANAFKNCKQNSEKGMNFTCSADFKCLDGEPTSFLAETAADKTGWLDIADWNRDGLLDVMHVLGERDVRFWMSGFCWPALACSGKGTCRHAEGRCDCIQGHHMSDCSACSEGYYTPDEFFVTSHSCLPCAGEEDGRPCFSKGHCLDDALAKHKAKETKLSNTSIQLATGDGNCSCTERFFGGSDSAGRLTCGAGLCPGGSEEVFDENDQTHHCEVCPAGRASSWNSSTCELCAPGRAAAAGSDECKVCPPGTVARFGGLGACQRCLAGTYANEEATACWPCLPGTMSDEGGECSDCTPGRFSQLPGSSTCESCEAGSFSLVGRSRCDQCPAGTISGPGSAQCTPCEGVFLQATPDEQHTTCQPSARSWSMGLVFFASLLVFYQLLLYTFYYHLSIVDISPMSGQMILTVQQAHHLRPWRTLRPKIIMANTGAPQFDEAERLYEVGAWGSDQLVLFHPTDDLDPNAQTSMGDVRVRFPDTLCHVHACQVPLLVWLLSFAGATFASAFYLTVEGLFNFAGLSTFSFVAMNLFWGYFRPSHPLAKKCTQFLKLRADTTASACGRGPTRALQAQELQDFRDFFQSFIKDRSMKYVCENLVKPLTKEVRLSYAELVGAHQVQWFISHFWGTSFQHFTEAVFKHAYSVHHKWQEVTYWICTFANNQWIVEAELGNGQWQNSSFYLALTSSSCRGTVMVIDELALPLQRAWCLFEVLQTQLRATTETASAFEGLVLCTSTGVLRNGQGGVDVAMAIARQLAQLDLRDAQASAESDRLMIYALVEQMPGGFNAVNSFVRKSIRNSLLTMHQRFEEDFAQELLKIKVLSDAEETSSCLRLPDSCHGQKHLLRGSEPRGWDGYPWEAQEMYYVKARLMDWDNDDDADAVAIDKKDLLFYERVGEEFYLHNLTNFRLPQNVTEASQLDVADWDGDGIHDLLFFDQAGFQVWMSRRLADGSFEPPIALLSIRVPPHTYESDVKVDFFQAIDWDGDGDLDVLLGGYSFAIYLEHAHGELVQWDNERSPFKQLFQEPGKTLMLMHVVDWDADGDLDVLVFYNRNRCNGEGCIHLRPVVFVERLDDGTLLQHHDVLATGLGDYLQAVDWNGDGRLDLWVDRSLYNRSVDHSLVERVGRENPFLQGHLNVINGEPQFVDWNSDSEIDLIVAGNQQIQYFERRNGELNEVLDPGLGNVTVGNLDHYRLAAVDWDQDGDVDLLMTTDEGQIKYFERSGGSLVELTNHSFLHINATPPWHYSSWAYMPEIHCLQPVVADWDGDGDLDLLLAPAGLYFERLADGSLVEILQNPFADAVIENPAEQGGMGWKYVTWRAVDCNGDGALDLLRIHSDASQEGFSNYFANCKQENMNFTCLRDFQCLDGEPTSFLQQTRPEEIGWLEVADWNKDGLLDVVHVIGDRDVRFWMSGFCLPPLACSGKGTCRPAAGRCDCIQGHQMSDCSACSEGYYTPDEFLISSHSCLPCAGEEDHPCSRRGQCLDDALAKHNGKADNLSNTSVQMATGDGNCSCTERFFGGFDSTGRLTCGAGLCPGGSEEVFDENDQTYHCEVCPAGRASPSNGSRCVLCESGRSAVAGSQECQACSPGAVARFTGLGACQPCPAGTHANQAATACWPCLPGTISLEGSECRNCTAGRFSQLSGSSLCEGCAAGSFSLPGSSKCDQCPAGTISAPGSAKCSHCEGYFLQAIPDEQHTTCQPSARSWSMSSVFFVSLLVLFQLLIYTFRYHLSIVDISPMSGQMILTVQQAHHLRAWRKLRPKIIMANTGAPQFDEAERLYEVGSWGSDQLLLFHPADDHVDPNAQTSIGDVRVNFPGTLVHVHAFQIPLLVWLLLFAGGTFASAFYLTFDGIFIITGLSLLSCLALNIAWRYLRPSHPLAKKHAQFLQLRANVSACGRGPTRALQAQQLQDFRDFFQSFIKDRSMYYVCENLVKPLTKEVRLSYAELVGAHQVQWFISHFWGTSFQHFTEAVLKHGMSLNYAHWQEVTYWICTFANNQWAVEAELGNGQWQNSSFYLALTSSSCQGTSMIVDELALPLQRAWCLFEVLQTQLRATTETASAFEGLILCTSTGVLRNGQGGVDVAMAIARQLAQLDLRDAQASAESDRLMIYALVEQMPGGFDAVNGFVRSSIRDSLLTMHQRFEEDFAQVLQTLQASRDGTLPEERLPMLLGHTAMSRSSKTCPGPMQSLDLV
ncbi:unnamed protein product [Durusdinium trenchii]|uniref:Uncharacterized protein n=1 Tax=Durusdinium trenchii TaxID=1381693 RepID=A0ABP0HWU5_9DINO